MKDDLKFFDLPLKDFPFTIEFFKRSDGEIVHVVEVTGPGAVEIPGLKHIHGEEIGVRLKTPDGEVTEAQ